MSKSNLFFLLLVEILLIIGFGALIWENSKTGVKISLTPQIYSHSYQKINHKFDICKNKEIIENYEEVQTTRIFGFPIIINKTTHSETCPQ